MKNFFILASILGALSITATGNTNSHSNHMQIPASMQSEFDVMTPLDKIINKKFTGYQEYEKYSHAVMMNDSSKYLTKDTGNIFAVYMTLHHEAAIITSLGIVEISDNPSIVKLATNIANAQVGEVNEMQKLLSSGVLKGNNNNKFQKEMADIMNNMMDNMYAPDTALTKSESEELYLTNMIAHHEGAIEMAKAYLKVGKNPRLIKICQDILRTQGEEINEMKLLLKK